MLLSRGGTSKAAAFACAQLASDYVRAVLGQPPGHGTAPQPGQVWDPLQGSPAWHLQTPGKESATEAPNGARAGGSTPLSRRPCLAAVTRRSAGLARQGRSRVGLPQSIPASQKGEHNVVPA